MNRTRVFVLAAVAPVAAVAQQSIKPRTLPTPIAISKEALGSATLARQLPNGSVLVNDAARRRLLLLDPTLQSYTVVADSTSGSVNGYGQRPGALIPYVSDSTLYLDVTAGSFLVIDPNGKVARVMSTPRPQDNNFLTAPALGYPGFDAKGRLVYRSRFQPQLMQTRDGGIQMGQAPDSAPVIRVDLDTRKADTIGAMKLARNITSTGTGPNGGTFTMSSAVPLPTVDDWAVLSDGSVAIVRGQDYHIDWILPDGSKKSTGKVPFDWQRLTDDDKAVVIDSIVKARQAMAANGGPMIGGGTQMVSFGPGGGGGRGSGDVVVGDRMMVTQMMGAEIAGRAAAQGAPAPAAATPSTTAKPADAPKADAKPADGAKPNASNGNNDKPSANANDKPAPASAPAGPAPMALPGPPIPVASDLPDYRPAFGNPAARADVDANVWVRTSKPGSMVGSLVYDVINNKGELVDRVEVPAGMAIVGFGKGGIVYLTRRDADGLHLLKSSLR